MQKIDFVNGQAPALNEENLNLMQLYIEQAINAQVSGDTLPIGAIIPYSSDNVPENWLLANGQAVSRTDYNHLFSIIGTTYGEGDGSTTFNLPNLCGRVVVGQDENDTDFDEIGKMVGEKKHTMTLEELVQHYHNDGVRTNSLFGEEGTGQASCTVAIDKTQGTTSSTGGSKPFNIVQPSIVCNYIIKANQSAGIVANVLDVNSNSNKDIYSCNYINNLNTFSTAETKVGTWIDGKDIYRKVLFISELNNDNIDTTISHNIQNLGQVTDVRGVVTFEHGQFKGQRMLPCVHGSGGEDYIFSMYNISDTEITITTGAWWRSGVFKEAYIILEYTKRTV